MCIKSIGGPLVFDIILVPFSSLTKVHVICRTTNKMIASKRCFIILQLKNCRGFNRERYVLLARERYVLLARWGRCLYRAFDLLVHGIALLHSSCTTNCFRLRKCSPWHSSCTTNWSLSEHSNTLFDSLSTPEVCQALKYIIHPLCTDIFCQFYDCRQHTTTSY